jgi:hypothetical protein
MGAIQLSDSYPRKQSFNRASLIAAEAAGDAASEHMEPAEAVMVHQRRVIRCRSVQAVIGLDIGALLPGVALIG